MSFSLLVLTLLLAASTAELSGRIVDDQNQPVGGAIVVVSSARPRVGPATTCPSCYRDCTKRTRTDDDGKFVIAELSDKLQFRLAVGGPGYRGVVSDHFDPASKPEIEIQLPLLPQSPEAQRAVGRVVDLAGQPIAGAEVSTHTIYRTTGVFGGSEPSVSPLTLTDEKGLFEISAGDIVRAIDFRVSASGYAPNQVSWTRKQGEPLRIVLGRGASIEGKLMLEGEPLSSVEVGIVQKNRFMGNIVTPTEVFTDETGRFLFEQLPPSLEYAIYTHTGQDARGVLPVSLMDAPEHGQRAVLGEIPTESPHRLTITVLTDDGSVLPEKSFVSVSRQEGWRGSTLHLARVPKDVVTLSDVGKEVFRIHVRVPGYVVIKTRPPANVDMNKQYSVSITGDQAITIVVTKNANEAKTSPEKSST